MLTGRPPLCRVLRFESAAKKRLCAGPGACIPPLLVWNPRHARTDCNGVRSVRRPGQYGARRLVDWRSRTVQDQLMAGLGRLSLPISPCDEPDRSGKGYRSRDKSTLGSGNHLHRDGKKMIWACYEAFRDGLIKVNTCVT